MIDAKMAITEKWMKSGLLDDMPTPENKSALAVILNNVSIDWFEDTYPWLDTKFVFPVVTQTLQNLIKTLGSENVEATLLPAGIDKGTAFVVGTHILPIPEHLATPEDCSIYAEQLTTRVLDLCKQSGKQRIIIYNLGFRQNFQFIRLAFL